MMNLGVFGKIAHKYQLWRAVSSKKGDARTCDAMTNQEDIGT